MAALLPGYLSGAFGFCRDLEILPGTLIRRLAVPIIVGGDENLSGFSLTASVDMLIIPGRKAYC